MASRIPILRRIWSMACPDELCTWHDTDGDKGRLLGRFNDHEKVFHADGFDAPDTASASEPCPWCASATANLRAATGDLTASANCVNHPSRPVPDAASREGSDG